MALVPISHAQNARQYRREIATTRRKRDWAGLSQALSNLADFQRRRGKLDEALSLAREALKIARRTKNRENESHALCVRGLIEHRKGRWRQAIDWHMRAWDIDRKHGSLSDDAWHLNHIANARKALGDVEDALEGYRLAARTLKHLRDPDGFASVIGNMASLESDRGRLKTALRLQRQALALHRRYGAPIDIAIDLNVLADILRAQGKLGLAERYTNQSLVLYRQLGDPNGIAGRLLDLAYIAEDRKDFKLSKRLALRAADWYEKAGLPSESNRARTYANDLPLS